jgi:hypothetical protein
LKRRREEDGDMTAGESGGGSDLLAEVSGAARVGNLDALARVREIVAARRGEPGGHANWARLCEEAGEFGLALGEYQLTLRDDPTDTAALARLAVLYEERGDVERAVECAERWHAAAPSDPEALSTLVDTLAAAGAFERAGEVLDGARASTDPQRIEGLARRVHAARSLLSEEEPSEPEQVPLETSGPTDADVIRFAHLFAGRENVHARQWWSREGKGGYTPVHEPLTFQVARNHLLGNVTVGTYVVRLDDTVTFFAIDLDITKRAIAAARSSLAEARRLKDLVASEAGRVHQALADLGLPAVMEDSGYKGRHLWVFLEAPEPAPVVHQFGTLFLTHAAPRGVDLHGEFFPKQASAGDGIGNLIKLPLGVHRRTGRWSRLMRADGTPDPDPHATLRAHPRVSRAALHAVVVALKQRPAPAGGARAPASESEAEPVLMAPVPPLEPPAWTAADFETNNEVHHLMSRCAVLGALREKAERYRRLDHDEQVVLAHSLGHSASGVLAVNYLLDHCVDVAPNARLQSPLAGNPISCPKIRKRIPQVTAKVPCNCRFDFAPDHYPTPRLHLRTLPPATPVATQPAWDAVERARTLGVLWRQQREIAEQVTQLQQELVAYLEREGQSRLELDDGVFRLHREFEGLQTLVWEPGPSGDAPRATQSACEDAAPGV